MLRKFLSRRCGFFVQFGCAFLFVLLLSASYARSEAAQPASTPTVLGLGIAHSCVLTDGGLRCWGSNNLGQLGTGDNFDRPVPAQVSGLGSSVIGVAAGTLHTCALTSDGGVKCWGTNAQGQLGNGTSTGSNQPVAVTGLAAGVKAIASGYDHTCALLTTGAVKCWGLNANGQLGAGAIGSTSTVPVSVLGIANAVALTGGGAHTCALLNDASVKCWGYNFYGSLGNGNTDDQNTPTGVVNLGAVRQLGAGYLHTCALLNSGAIKCWGLFADLWTSTPIDMPGFSGINAIAANGSYLCGLNGAAGVQCMGSNGSGQLGDGTTIDRNAPVNVVGLSGVSALGAGVGHVCAVAAGGLRCWGGDSLGQLGMGNSSYVRSLLDDLSGMNFVDIAMGPLHACGISDGGAVMCWGQSHNGELGIGPTQAGSTVSSPQQAQGLTGGATSVSVGQQYTCAVVNGGAQCWGRNTDGQLGNGSTKEADTPQPVTGLGAGVTRIAAADSAGDAAHTCAVVGGAAKCWGGNYLGQLGNGQSDVIPPQTTPVDVVGLGAGVTDIAAGASHSCAVVNGGVQCWGLNYYGQLGNGASGTYTRYPTPVNVAGLGGAATAVVAGTDFTCALIGGGARCWGRGEKGQLGVSAWPSLSATPVTPNGMESGVTSIAAARTGVCAVKAGAVYCWGDLQPTPQMVFKLQSGYSKVTVNGDVHCAIGADGAICWGKAVYGTLGDGRVNGRTTPVPVLGFGPGPELHVHYSTAASGSLLTLIGANLPPFAAIPIQANGQPIGEVVADYQGFVRTLLKTAGAAPGYYRTQGLANGAPVETGFTIASDAPQRGAEGGSSLGSFLVLTGQGSGNPTPAPQPTPAATPVPGVSPAAAPVVTQVLPSQGGRDLPAEVELYGANFKPGAVAYLNPGKIPALRSVYISPDHLSVLWLGGIVAQQYSVTVINPDWSQGSLAAGYMATDAVANSPTVQDDLYGMRNELTSSRVVEYVGEGSQLWFAVHRLGGAADLSNVRVRFYVGPPGLSDPASQATLVGDGIIATLGPNRTFGVYTPWAPAEAGTFEVYAVIDPENSVAEVNEANNIYHNWVQVKVSLPPDATPPVVDAVNAPLVTASSSVVLSVSGHDEGGSGVAWADFVVWEYFPASRTWVAMYESGWLDFSGSDQYLYDFGYFSGPRFIDVWVADAAKNISEDPKSVLVNYLKPQSFVIQGESELYLFPLAQNGSLSADLRPIYSLDDADLYVWPPDYPARNYWVSANDGMAPEHIAINAPVGGYYWLEAYGYASSFYTLGVGVGAADAASGQGPRTDKPLRSYLLGADTEPSHIYRLTSDFDRIFLPSVKR